MDLTPYIDRLRNDLLVAAETGGPESRATAERLVAPLESSIRLLLLDALSAAADEVTREVAPTTVDVRLRGGDPEFVVTAPAPGPPTDELAEPVLPVAPDVEDGATVRINLRLPEQLKASIEQAAGRQRLSVNAWLVRAAATAVAAPSPEDRGRRGGRGLQSFTGWVQ